MARGASFLYRALARLSFSGCAFPCRGKRPGARSKASFFFLCTVFLKTLCMNLPNYVVHAILIPSGCPSHASAELRF